MRCRRLKLGSELALKDRKDLENLAVVLSSTDKNVSRSVRRIRVARNQANRERAASISSVESDRWQSLVQNNFVSALRSGSCKYRDFAPSGCWILARVCKSS